MEQKSTLSTLRDSVISFNKAFSENDLETYFSYYAEDATFLTPAGSLQTISQWNDEWTEVVRSGTRVVKMDSNGPDSIRISADGKSAVVLSFNESSVTFADPNGVETKIDWPESAVWWNIEGKWKIVHMHYHEPANTE